MASSFFWYELLTTEVAAAEAFYKNVVGWSSQPFPGSDYVVFNAGELGVAGAMRLPDEAKAMGTPPCWLGYVHAEDVDAATASLKKAGGAVHREPSDIPSVGRFSVVADPQGATFMLMTPTGTGRPTVPLTTPGHIGWHELYASDWKSAFDFYAKQFGWKKGDAMDMGPMGTYQLFSADGGEPIGGMMTKPENIPHPNWLFYFNVGNIDQAAKRVKDGGGQVLLEPMEVPGGGWIVQCSDPQGAMFALAGNRA